MKNDKKTNEDRKNRFTEQGNRLLKCLNRAGMKQKDLADEMKRRHNITSPDLFVISPQFVYKMVHGIAGIPAHHIDEIADILHVRREYLLLRSDYMTEEERLHDIGSARAAADSLCLDLLASMGYQIQDTEKQPDGGYASMHRPYCQITINKRIDKYSQDDTDEEILKKAHDAPPVRIYKITTPDGKRIQVTQTDLRNIITNIQTFARFQIETINPHRM